MTRVEPLEDRIIVKAAEAASMSKGGLYIPEIGKDKPQTGTVVEAGPGKFEFGAFIETKVQKGDTILFGKYSGMEVTLNGEKVLILRFSDVLARVHESGNEA